MPILIDNATISSVQRALGLASIADRSVLDVEQAALGRFSEAVLFQDQVLVPDNYKAELTESRKKLLDYPVFGFCPISAEEDNAFLESARALTGVWREAFDSQQSSGLFPHYFQQIHAISHLLWEHSSSEFFLVFRAFGIDKESPLIEALLASRGNEDLGRSLEIVGRDGSSVNWDKLSRHMQRMMSVFGWLGHQYIWHQIMAANAGHVYLPHPLRDFFAHDFMRRINIGSKDPGEFSRIFSEGIERFRGTIADAVEELGRSPEAWTVTIHSLLPLVVRECSSGKDFVETLVQVREEPDVRAMRDMLRHVDEAIGAGDFGPAHQLKDEIESIGRNILVERGIEKRYVTLSPPSTFVGINVSGDPLQIRCPLPSALYKQFFLGKRYRAVIRRVFRELAVPGQLGDAKDKLDSFAWISGDGYPKFYLKRDRLPSKFHREFREGELQEDP